jgi:hypothetical protein
MQRAPIGALCIALKHKSSGLVLLRLTGLVRSMRIVPVSMDVILWVAVATLAPVVPLTLTMMPLDEVVKVLLGLVF